VQQSHKKICVEKPEAIKNNKLTTTRYLAYNGIFINQSIKAYQKSNLKFYKKKLFTF